MKKLIVLIFLLLVPSVLATNNNPNPIDFGALINQLVTSMINSIKNLILDIVNAPISPLVSFLKSLIQEPVNIDLYGRYWEIITYVISLFYGLIMLTAGFNFIVSSYDIVKRERAKEWFRNSILIIILVSSSYLIYKMLIDLSAIINSGILNLVNPNLFVITIDNPVNFGLELLLYFSYIFTLLITIILLGIRYLLTSLGLVLFPIGIALNYIPPLKSYGKLILNLVFTFIFIPIIVSLVFVISSQLLNVGIYSWFKILVTLTALWIVNLLLVFSAIFVGIKAVSNVASSDVAKAVKLASGMV